MRAVATACDVADFVKSHRQAATPLRAADAGTTITVCSIFLILSRGGQPIPVKLLSAAIRTHVRTCTLALHYGVEDVAPVAALALAAEASAAFAVLNIYLFRCRGGQSVHVQR